MYNVFVIFYLYIYIKSKELYNSQAGGLATTGTQRVLEIKPDYIHQRCPIFLGSKDDVEDLIACFRKYA